jgi:hypothetical protein
MWLSGRDSTLPCFRQTKDAFTSVLSRPDVDPTLPAQQGQSASKRCAVHGKAGTQRFLVRLADNAEGGQQTKLGDFDVGLAEFLVVDPRDESCETAKILTSASEREKCVCAMNVLNWPVHNSMYIHLMSPCVKERRRLISHAGYKQASSYDRSRLLSGTDHRKSAISAMAKTQGFPTPIGNPATIND